MRICSLLPSATEIVCALGIGDQLVGVSHECDFPEEILSKPRVTNSMVLSAKMSSRQIDRLVRHHVKEAGSLHQLDAKLLQRLKPDLILTQELCHVCAASYGEVEKACRILEGNPSIISLEPHNLSEIFESILLVGELTRREDEASMLVDGLRGRVKRLAKKIDTPGKLPKVFCMEWIDPPWVGGHWIPEMVQIAGGFDGLGRTGQPSRRLDWDEIVRYAPEVFIAMPCGFDVKATEREAERLDGYQGWEDMPAVRDGRVYAVDGSSYFSRSGPRIVDGLQIMASMLHPGLNLRLPVNAMKRIS